MTKFSNSFLSFWQKIFWYSCMKFCHISSCMTSRHLVGCLGILFIWPSGHFVYLGILFTWASRYASGHLVCLCIWASCLSSGHLVCLGILFVWASCSPGHLAMHLGILFVWASGHLVSKIFKNF